MAKICPMALSSSLMLSQCGTIVSLVKGNVVIERGVLHSMILKMKDLYLLPLLFLAENYLK